MRFMDNDREEHLFVFQIIVDANVEVSLCSIRISFKVILAVSTEEIDIALGCDLAVTDGSSCEFVFPAKVVG